MRVMISNVPIPRHKVASLVRLMEGAVMYVGATAQFEGMDAPAVIRRAHAEIEEAVAGFEVRESTARMVATALTLLDIPHTLIPPAAVDAAVA